MKISLKQISVLLFLCIVFCYRLDAQGYIRESKQAVASPSPQILFSVYESKADGQCLPGASIVIRRNKDSLSLVTDAQGFAFCPIVYAGDSIDVSIAFLGYKPVSGRFFSKKNTWSVDVGMEEDPLQLSAIIIDADNVKMIVHGDTTIYNASRFKTEEGASLRSLLKRLPGIEIKGDNIYAAGSAVSKVLVNGNALFGSNIHDAMDILYSKEVSQIRIYDRLDPERMDLSDTLHHEKVVDVKTKVPIKLAGDLYLAGLAGAYTSKASKEENPVLSLYGGYRRYDNDGPDISLSGAYGKDVTNQGILVCDTPADEGLLSLKYSGKIKDVQTELKLNLEYSGKKDRNKTTDIYYPPELFNNRKSVASYEKSDVGFRTTGEFSLFKRFSRRSSLKSITNFGYEGLSSNMMNSILVSDNYSNNGSHVRNFLKSGSFFGSEDINYRQTFKNKLSLNSGINISLSSGNGFGERVDTSVVSSVAQWLSFNTNNTASKLSFTISLKIPLYKKLLLTPGVSSSIDNTESSRYSMDEIIHKADSINTFDYREQLVSNAFSLGFTRGANNDKLSFHAGVKASCIIQYRHEYIPQSYENHRYEYLLLNPYADIHLSFPALKLSLGYSEHPVLPSAIQLRQVIDNASPLFLTAGNENIKNSTDRKISFAGDLSIFGIAAALKLNVDYTNTSDYITTQTKYFSEDTRLYEYGYIAIAGSRLSRPINVSGADKFNSELSFSIAALSSTFNPFIGYYQQRLPFYNNEYLHWNSTISGYLGIRYLSSFSTSFSTGINIRSDWDRNYRDRNALFSDYKMSASAFFTKRIGNFSITPNYYLSIFRPTGGLEGFAIHVLDATVSYEFGENSRYKVALEGHDLLNKNNPLSVYSIEDAVRTSITNHLGRAVLVRLSMRLDQRK